MRFSGIGSPGCELGSREIGSIDSACMRMAPWESMKGPHSETRRGPSPPQHPAATFRHCAKEDFLFIVLKCAAP